jgi:LPS sulfotransferase NodH
MSSREPRLPTTSYLVCATQRSGSTLLCKALARTGVAGVPDEYFEGLTETKLPRAPRRWFEELEDREAVSRLSDEWGPPHTSAMNALAESRSYSDYLGWVFEQGTTSNGIFGSKMMWSYLHDFAEQAGECEEYRGLPLDALLGRVFPSLRYIWVTRRDKVRQAVSMWKAAQTQTWRAESGDGSVAAADAELTFDYEAIDSLKHLMAAHDAAWCAHFFRSGTKPLTIVYEDFENAYETTLARILAHLGVPVEPGTIPDPPTEKQADTISEQWVKRYRVIEAERALTPLGPRRPFPQRLTRADGLWWQPEPEFEPEPATRPRRPEPGGLPAPRPARAA